MGLHIGEHGAALGPVVEADAPAMQLDDLASDGEPDADAAIVPTHWQASTFPQRFRERITVAHDGVDTVVSLCPVTDGNIPAGVRHLEVRLIDEVAANANLDFVLKMAVPAKFRNAGQVCISPTRFLVQEKAYDRFVDSFVKDSSLVNSFESLSHDNFSGFFIIDNGVYILDFNQ